MLLLQLVKLTFVFVCTGHFLQSSQLFFEGCLSLNGLPEGVFGDDDIAKHFEAMLLTVESELTVGEFPAFITLLGKLEVSSMVHSLVCVVFFPVDVLYPILIVVVEVV